MSIASIGSSALSPFGSLRVRPCAKDSGSDAAATQPASSTCAAARTCAAPPAQSSPVQATGCVTGSSGLTVQESHLALQIRSRTELRTASNGTVSERDTAKLRFHYDLTTADGQHVELNVKAKVRQASVQDEAGNFASKTRVRLQFSLLLEGVADGLSPLQSDQVPGDTRSGVADGLQAFLNSVGDALQQFVEGDGVTADDLVTKTADTFNTLVDALTNLLFHPTGNEATPALPSGGEVTGQIPMTAPTPLGNTQLIPSEPAADILRPAPLSPLPAEANGTNELPEPETPMAASADSSLVDVPAIPADSIPAGQGDPVVQPGPTEASVAQPLGPNAAASPTQLAATHVLQTVRFRFVQSLTQIIRTLTPAEQLGDSSSSSFQLLIYQSSLSLGIRTASLVDVNA